MKHFLISEAAKEHPFQCSEIRRNRRSKELSSGTW